MPRRRGPTLFASRDAGSAAPARPRLAGGDLDRWTQHRPSGAEPPWTDWGRRGFRFGNGPGPTCPCQGAARHVGTVEFGAWSRRRRSLGIRRHNAQDAHAFRSRTPNATDRGNDSMSRSRHVLGRSSTLDAAAATPTASVAPSPTRSCLDSRHPDQADPRRRGLRRMANSPHTGCHGEMTRGDLRRITL